MLLEHAFFVIVILTLLLLGIVLLVLAGDTAIAQSRHEAHERAALKAAVGFIVTALQSMNRSLLYLSGQSLLLRVLDDPSPETKRLLAEEWLAFARSRGEFDKIRWIDEHGRELLRVNYNNGAPYIVDESALQDRQLRYFFHDTMRLPPGEIYVSPFDLNVEHESIEIPYKPTIRIGTPLFDSHGQPRGILLLNYLGGQLFAQLDQAIARSDVRPWLVNADGHWLRGPNVADEWGFMRGRPELTMAARYPAVWAQMLAAPSGQFADEHGLWTFETVYPLLEGQKTSAGSANLFSPSGTPEIARQYFWKVITLLPHSRYRRERRQESSSTMQSPRFLMRLMHRARQIFGPLRHANHRTRLAAEVFEHTAEGVAITDAEGYVQMVNAAFTRITGLAESEAIGKTADFLYSGHHPPEFFKALWQDVKRNGYWQGEIWGRRKNGELYANWVSISGVRDNGGAIRHYIALFSDITAMKESAQRMEHFAHHDMLTGLPNRRLLTARLEHSIKRASRTGHLLALLFIDLDNFKEVNDVLGHGEGDKLLQEVGHRLSGILREEDTLARIGGDEFVILLESLAVRGDINRVIDTVLSLFPCRRTKPGGDIVVTASIGVSFYPDHGRSAATLLGSADHAMYQAKQGGRNRAFVNRPGSAS